MENLIDKVEAMSCRDRQKYGPLPNDTRNASEWKRDRNRAIDGFLDRKIEDNLFGDNFSYAHLPRHVPSCLHYRWQKSNFDPFRDEEQFDPDIVPLIELYKEHLYIYILYSFFSFWAKNHDYESEEEQALFKSMVGKQSDTYLQWALKELSKWQTPTLPPSTIIFQINGDKDKTFPIKKIKSPDVVVENGGHFMVYKQPELISECIVIEIQKIINF